jgi:hypothetical protein
MPHKLSYYLVKFLKIITIVFSLALIIWFFYQSIRNHNNPDGNDLTALINASRQFYVGENPYTIDLKQYFYPLFVAMAVYPLAFLQSGYIHKIIAASLWSLLSYLAFFLTIIMSWRFVDRVKSGANILRQNLFPIALLILMLYPFLREEFQSGQINLIILGGIGGFFGMLRKDRQLWAALFLSMAASISVGPAVCILYVFFTRQYRAAMAFIPLLFLLNVGFPYLINPQSLEYCGYFMSEIVPNLTENWANSELGSFSLLGSLENLCNLSLSINSKLALTGLCAIGLLLPPTLLAAGYIMKAGRFYIYTFFATIICITALLFPLFKSYHLLIMTIPFIAILIYWKKTIKDQQHLWKDGLSLLFLGGVIALHLGQIFMIRPIGLLVLLGIYVGFNILLSKMKGG